MSKYLTLLYLDEYGFQSTKWPYPQRNTWAVAGKDMTAGEIMNNFSISGLAFASPWPAETGKAGDYNERKEQFIYYSLNTVVDEILKWLLQFKKKN